jgi:hypothetical protein
MYGVSNKSIFYYMLFFYEKDWIGGLNDGFVVLYTRHWMSIIVPSRSCVFIHLLYWFPWWIVW